MQRIGLVFFGIAIGGLLAASTLLSRPYSVSIDLTPDPNYGDRGKISIENFAADRYIIRWRSGDIIVNSGELRDALKTLDSRRAR